MKLRRYRNRKNPSKSKKKLFADLDILGYAGYDLKHKNVGNETYGQDSHIYIYFPKANYENQKIGRKLHRLGHNVNFGYGQVNPKVLDIKVTYFKGYHWEE